MESFIEVREFLHQIPDIHSGGCAIAALAMKRWLKKYEGMDCSIVYHQKIHSFYETNEKVKNNLAPKNNATSCSHAYISFDGKDLVDCLTYNMKQSGIMYNDLTEDIVVASINCAGSWNPSFDRKYVNSIAAKLNIDLSDIRIN